MNITQTPNVVKNSLNSRFYKGEPIWLTNQNAGEKRGSAIFRWPAGNGHYSGIAGKLKYFK